MSVFNPGSKELESHHSRPGKSWTNLKKNETYNEQLFLDSTEN